MYYFLNQPQLLLPQFWLYYCYLIFYPPVQLLTELDGVETLTGVFVFAATRLVFLSYVIEYGRSSSYSIIHYFSSNYQPEDYLVIRMDRLSFHFLHMK